MMKKVVGLVLLVMGIGALIFAQSLAYGLHGLFVVGAPYHYLIGSTVFGFVVLIGAGIWFKVYNSVDSKSDDFAVGFGSVLFVLGIPSMLWAFFVVAMWMG